MLNSFHSIIFPVRELQPLQVAWLPEPSIPVEGIFLRRNDNRLKEIYQKLS